LLLKSKSYILSSAAKASASAAKNTVSSLRRRPRIAVT